MGGKESERVNIYDFFKIATLSLPQIQSYCGKIQTGKNYQLDPPINYTN